MKKLFLFGFIVINLVCLGTNNIYQKTNIVKIKSNADKLLATNWKENGIVAPFEASDFVMLRRLYLSLAGRLPTIEEAKTYLANPDAKKYEKLVDKLLNSQDFVNLWSMYFSDILRLKSEFPINLWPNAVYPYHRRIQNFLKNNEPYDKFVNSLLLSEGSNFKIPEVNFYRSTPIKTHEGIATIVARSFMGIRYEKLSLKNQKALATFFQNISYHSTKEWKEELVYVNIADKTQTINFLDKNIKIMKNSDPRESFCNYLMQKDNPYFSRFAIEHVMFRLFGTTFHQIGDDFFTPVINQELLSYLADFFIENNYDLRKLIKVLVNSMAYKASSLEIVNRDKRIRHFATYKMRRVDAEVLDDMLCDITQTDRSYSSVIPEPFSYLPPKEPTVNLADGSITSSFLLLFGRSARDSGLFEEKISEITAKQRQYLFNSGELERKLHQMPKRFRLNWRNFDKVIQQIYLLIYSRYPTSKELDFIKNNYRNGLKKKIYSYKFIKQLIWSLINSQEFLYQH